MASTHQLPIPFQILGKAFSFTSPDEEKWWLSTAPMFATMLSNANYDHHIQYQFLCLHRDLIIPSLGRYHKPGETRWKSVLTRFGLPFELSFNYTKALARFTFEPISPQSGTGQDPFNTEAIWGVLNRFEKLVPDLDLELIRHFVHELVVSKEEARAIIAEDPGKQRAGIYLTQNKLAVDLNPDGQILLKTYIYLETKAFATGKSRKQLIFDAVRKADLEKRIEPSLSTLDKFLEAGHTSLEPYFLSCDLVKRSQSRIKIYFMQVDLPLASLVDIWTVGGRRSDPQTMKGLEHLEMLWNTLPRAKDHYPLPTGHHGLGSSPTERLPFIINFCLHPNDPVPEPQIYFPAFGLNDQALADGLTAFFEHVGMSDVARSYTPQLRAYYPNQDLDKSNHIQTWISFSMKQNKPYMSVYIHTFEAMGQIIDSPRVWEGELAEGD